MERERGTKIIAIIALCVGIVGLSVGFAAFSNTLTISSSATVKPDESTFNVDFSSSDTVLAVNDIAPTLSPATLTASSAKIDNSSDPKITGLNVEFTEPGQSATYTFYARNEGVYNAYLNSITIGNVLGKEVSRYCEGTADAEGRMPTPAYVTAACDDITLTVKAGTLAATDQTVSTLTGHVIAPKGTVDAGNALIDYEPIVVTITYAANGDRADGNFSVSFGDIVLNYGSAD